MKEPGCNGPTIISMETYRKRVEQTWIDMTKALQAGEKFTSLPIMTGKK
jgi:hypothetical protein